MKKRDRETRVHGQILDVWVETLGSVLTADAAAGATTIAVADVAPFEPDAEGGTLKVGDQTIGYTLVVEDDDEDGGTITLAGPLIEAVEDGEDVVVWNELYDEVDTTKMALVQVDGVDDNEDPIEATVVDSLVLATGQRGRAGETCTLERDGDEWEVIRVKGRPVTASAAGGVKYEADDVHTITAGEVAAGSVLMSLSHIPIEESLIAFWGGVPQRPTEYTINYGSQTISFPLAGFEKAGDLLWVHYAYITGMSTPTATDPPPTLDLDTPNTYFVPASITSFTSTGINTDGHGDTDLAGVGSYSAESGSFTGSNSGKVAATVGLPAWVSGCRVFIVGNFSDSHMLSVHDHLSMEYGEWAIGSEGGRANVAVFYSAQLQNNYSGGNVEPTYKTTGGPVGPNATGIEVFGTDAAYINAIAGCAAGQTNVQVTAWGSDSPIPSGDAEARRWETSVAGIWITYPASGL